MNFLKNIFNAKKEPKEDLDALPLDERFVKKFKEKGGKFLYCANKHEVVRKLLLIFKEHSYDKILCYDYELVNLIKLFKINIYNEFSDEFPFLTKCEYLIGNEGDILFSSNQLNSRRLNTYNENFIVFAKTSQIVKNINQAMMGINTKYKEKLPTNITNIRYYNLKENEENFMNYGNTNAKDLYLILLEDL